MPSGFGKQYLPNANVFCIQYGTESQSDSETWSHPGHDERKGEDTGVCFAICRMERYCGQAEKQINRTKDKVTFYLQICPRGATLEQCLMPLCGGGSLRTALFSMLFRFSPCGFS